MKDRIILLIKAKNLSAAQFADEIGVQKSSISHIISGRNNASLDFIQKILFRYPDVNMEWLMFGKGPLFKGTEIPIVPNKDESSGTSIAQNMPPVDLFSSINTDTAPDFRKENELSLEPKPDKITDNENLIVETPIRKKEKTESNQDIMPRQMGNRNIISGHEHTGTKFIVKIVEFYSDQTYKEYFPE